MTRNMTYWQMDKAVKALDLNDDFLEGIIDGLEYLEKHVNEVNEEELSMIKETLKTVQRNDKLCKTFTAAWSDMLFNKIAKGEDS